MKKSVLVVIISMITLFVCLVTACNVTRTITTTSQVITRGDTTTTISSRTIESYDAQKRSNF